MSNLFEIVVTRPGLRMKSIVSKTVTANDLPKTNFLAHVVIGIRTAVRLVNTLFPPTCPHDVKIAITEISTDLHLLPLWDLLTVLTMLAHGTPII